MSRSGDDGDEDTVDNNAANRGRCCSIAARCAYRVIMTAFRRLRSARVIVI
jgi:hypothetical protein